MKKRKLQENPEERIRQNPVAKFAGRFNKAAVFGDKTRYNRKTKHAKREQEASPSVYEKWMGKPPALLFA